MVSAIVDETNRALGAAQGVHVIVWRWETDAFPGFHVEGPQGLIDQLMRLEDADLVVGIFWKRFGTPTATGQTGTEHELERAIDLWREVKRPQIMMYFSATKHSPESSEETKQWGAVLDFKKRFPKEGLWWGYKGVKAFGTAFRGHLQHYLSDFAQSKTPNPEVSGTFTPPRFVNAVLRPQLLAKIHEAAEAAPLIVLAGLSGSGKSYAASSYLETRRPGAQVLWYEPESGESLDSLLLATQEVCHLTGSSAAARCKSLVTWLKSGNRVLVLDDYHLVDQVSYGALVEQSARSGAPASFFLLSQTFVEPPGTVDMLQQVQVGGFSLEETQRYLATHQADGIDAAVIEDLVEKTGGLPFATMLFAVLVSQYNRDPAELVAGSIAENVRLRRWFDGIASSIGQSAFGLLQRLSLCSGPFNMGIVGLLARQDPMANYRDDFSRLQRNLLVQRYTHHSWRIHDLIALICRGELDPATQERIHSILGDHFVRRATETQSANRSLVLDQWAERACREFLKTASRIGDGKKLLHSVAASAKAEGRYDLFIDLSKTLIGKLSGEDVWIEYHHAHCAYVIGADQYALQLARPLSLAKGHPRLAGLKLAAVRLCAEIIAARGDLEAARRILKSALDGHPSNDARAATVISHARSVLAGLLAEGGKTDEAMSIIEALIREAEERRDPRGGAVALVRKALTLSASGNLTESLALLEVAQHVFRDCGDKRAEGWVQTNRAEVAFRTGSITNGLTFLQSAEQIHADIGLATLDHRNQIVRIGENTTDGGVREAVSRELSRIDAARALATRRLLVR